MRKTGYCPKGEYCLFSHKGKSNGEHIKCTLCSGRHDTSWCKEQVCGTCKKKGHTKRFCEQSVCSTCGGKGHVARDCASSSSFSRIFFGGQPTGQKACMRPYVNAVVGGYGTVLGLDTMCEGNGGALPWSYAQTLIDDGAELITTEEKISVASGPPATTKGKMRVEIQLVDHTTGDRLSFDVMMTVLEMNIAVPVLSWETINEMELVIGPKKLTSMGRKGWSSELVSGNYQAMDEESAKIAMLQAGDPDRQAAIRSMKESLIKSDSLFRLTPITPQKR